MKAYTPQELREQIASNDYGAELCLQHAMLCMEKLSRDAERYRFGVSLDAMARMNFHAAYEAWNGEDGPEGFTVALDAARLAS